MPSNTRPNYGPARGASLESQDGQEQHLDLQKELRQYGARTIIEAVVGILAMVTAIVVCFFMDRNNKWGVVPTTGKGGRTAAAAVPATTAGEEDADPGASVQIRFYALAPVLTGILTLAEGLVLISFSKKVATFQKGASGQLPQLVQALHVLRVLLAVTLFAVLIGTILESSGQPHCSLGLALFTAVCLGVWFTTLRSVIRTVEREVKLIDAGAGANGNGDADGGADGDQEDIPL